MPCQPSHTKGPGADEYQADIGEREFFIKQQAEPLTVREQLVEALEAARHAAIQEWLYQTGQTVRPERDYPPQGSVCGELGDLTLIIDAAIERANREPTPDCIRASDACLCFKLGGESADHDLDTCIENARDAGRP